MGGSVASQQNERITMEYPSFEYFIFVNLFLSLTTYNCTVTEQAPIGENPPVIPNQITLSPVLPLDIDGGAAGGKP